MSIDVSIFLIYIYMIILPVLAWQMIFIRLCMIFFPYRKCIHICYATIDGIYLPLAISLLLSLLRTQYFTLNKFSKFHEYKHESALLSFV
jgi:hypothetical protein